MARQFFHAGFVAEDGSAGDGRTGIDRKDSDALTLLDQVQAKGLDEGGLPNPGNPGYTNPDTVAAVGQGCFEDLLCRFAMFLQGALNQGNCLGQGPAITTAQRCRIEISHSRLR